MLTLPYDHEARFEGRVVGKLGLAMTLWLDPNAPRPDTWRGILRAAEVYAGLAGHHLAWWSSTVRDEVSWLSTMAINSSDEGLAQDSAEELRQALHHVAREPFSAEALGAAITPVEPVLLELALGGTNSGSGAAGQEPWSDVLDWMFYANVPVEHAEVAGFIRVHVPTYAASDTHDAAQWLREFMRACVQVLPVLHGTAGWAVQLPLSYRYFHANLYAAVALFDLAQAHAGVDVYDPAEMAVSLTRNCYTANWLNYLGFAAPDQIATALSGTKPLRQSGLVTEQVGPGLFVQAGAEPALLYGWYSPPSTPSAQDRPADRVMELYRAAAAVLRPWRVTDPSNECIAPPRYGYADTPRWQAACEQYLRRFD